MTDGTYTRALINMIQWSKAAICSKEKSKIEEVVSVQRRLEELMAANKLWKLLIP